MKTFRPPADPSTVRPLGGGTVVGSVEPDGTHAWRGIRYAAPPVGAWRWRAPQPAVPQPGHFEALQHGPLAPQIAGLLAPVPPTSHGQVVGEEDCLWLNVHAPAWAPGQVPTGSARRPVMVWIHGGGNAVGTAAGYDVVRNLAAHDGVVVVTVNYRLGVLGWFAHPALQAQAGLTAEERSGNFALLDLMAALRWVQAHIASFGGDPGCVTIFGESAGGQNVLLLLASPLAAGLFHRAIAQSPVAETFSLDEAVHGAPSPLASRQAGGLATARRLGAPDGPAEATAACLRGFSPAQLIGAFQAGSVGIYLSPRPMRDGCVLPELPLPALFAAGRWNRVPVILGSNRDELRTFLADKPEHSRLLFGKVPLLHDRAAYVAESGVASRAWRAVHVDTIADAMREGGNDAVWTYRFDWDEAPAMPFVRPDILLGAAHAMEMPFVFRDVTGEFDIFKVFTPFNRRGRMAVAQAMGDAWTSFARDGRPALPGGVAWAPRPAPGVAGPDSLLIDSPRGGGLRMAPARETMAALKQALHQAALPGPLRCRIYARVFLWSPLFEGHGSEAEYNAWAAELGSRDPAAAHRPRLEV